MTEALYVSCLEVCQQCGIQFIRDSHVVSGVFQEWLHTLFHASTAHWRDSKGTGGFSAAMELGVRIQA